MTLGSRIKEYRLKRGFTQSNMADKLNMTEANFSSYERDKSVPPSEKLSQISTLLGVSTDYLLGKTNVPRQVEGYIKNFTRFEIFEDDLRHTINDLRDPSTRKFSPQTQQAIEIESEHIRNAHDIDFEFTPDDILQVCREVDDAGFIQEIIGMLHRVRKSVDNRVPSTNDRLERVKEFLKSEEGTTSESFVPPGVSGTVTLSRKILKLEAGYLHRIPLVGRVAAGNPILAIENPGEYIIIDSRINKVNSNSIDEYFALEVVGHSMEPTIYDGEIVLVKQQEEVETGQIGVFRCNGEEATIKRFAKEAGRIYLIPDNKQFPVQEYTNECVCIGKVIESIRRAIK